MKLKAIALSMMLAVSTPAFAAVGQGSCQNTDIPANEQTGEVLDNTQGGVLEHVSGVFELTNDNSRKVKITLVINHGAALPLRMKHATLLAHTTTAVPWMLHEDSGGFSVSIISPLPITCDDSDFTVTP